MLPLSIRWNPYPKDKPQISYDMRRIPNNKAGINMANWSIGNDFNLLNVYFAVILRIEAATM